jgi:cell wall-associated NlpC family hydrolase
MPRSSLRLRAGVLSAVTAGLMATSLLLPSSASALPAHPSVSYGAHSQDVAYAQRLLGVSPASGRFGPKTRAAVLAFQAGNGIPRTGTIGPLTWAALDRLAGASGASRSAPRAPAAPAPAAVSPGATGVIAAAQAASGGPYRYGGTSPAGFDCSGFTQYVYARVGVSLPHSAAGQRAVTQRIPASQAQPGDLVFFSRSGGYVYHVGIYAGGGMMYAASHPGVRVGLTKIYSSVTFGRP